MQKLQIGDMVKVKAENITGIVASLDSHVAHVELKNLDGSTSRRVFPFNEIETITDFTGAGESFSNGDAVALEKAKTLPHVDSTESAGNEGNVPGTAGNPAAATVAGQSAGARSSRLKKSVQGLADKVATQNADAAESNV